MRFEGSCHCGAVRFAVGEAPQWLTRCNCSSCRRRGGLWAHFGSDKVSLTFESDAVMRYIWGDKTLANVFCKTCACNTHWENLDTTPGARMGLNFSMCEPKAIEGLRIRRFDGADTWEFLD